VAGDHSFDITGEVDLPEVENAVNQAMKEISHRFDFKGSNTALELDKAAHEIRISSADEFKVKNVVQVLEGKLVKRGVPLKALSYGPIEPALGGTAKQSVALQQGIPTDDAREIVKIIKGMKLKVQAQIQGGQVRVRGKKIDDLQAVIKELKDRDLALYLSFENFR